MPSVLRYKCQREAVATIEAALANHGYSCSMPRQTTLNGGTVQVLERGNTYVLLATAPGSNTAEIEVWGVGQSLVVSILQSSTVQLFQFADPGLAISGAIIGSD